MVGGQTFGSQVTEEAIDIEGYNKVDPTTVTITLAVSGNVINFYYTARTDISYTVNYLEQGTDRPLAEAKVVENQTFGSQVTEEAIDIEGYNKVEPTTVTITLAVSGNVINFYYTARTDIEYHRKLPGAGTDRPLAEAKVVENQTFGSQVTEEAIDIEGYNKVEPTTVTITLAVSGNVINFYYTARTDIEYTVNYLEQGTDKSLAEAKVVENQTFGSQVTEEAIDIEGYNKVEPISVTITLDKVEGNVINFYYTARTDIEYTVNYLEQGTDKPLAEAKVVENQTFGSQVTEEAIDIEGYNKVDPTTVTITLDKVEGNVINFYYTARTDIEYTVNYLEQGTDKPLAEAKVVENQTFGSQVTEEAIDIEGYNKVDPTTVTITLAVSGNVINFYYVKDSEPHFNVYYHANYEGGSAPSDPNTYLEGDWVVVAGEINREGFAFVSWNTEADGSGIHYMPGQEFEMPAEDVNLYAQWAQAVNDNYSTKRNTRLAVAAPGVLNNDTFVPSVCFLSWNTDPQHGKLTFNDDGSFTYEPDSGFVGTDSFFYAIGFEGPVLEMLSNLEGNNGDNNTVENPDDPDDPLIAKVTITVTGGGGGGGGGGSTEEIVVEPEEPLVPLNKEDHFAYIAGYPDNTVRPEGNVTREEVAAVFYRLLDETYRDSVKTDVNNFLDVEADRWSNIQISTLAAIGVITGYPDGTFRPSNSITRAELATIASKFDKLSPFVADNFSDITGHWANQYINSAAQKGWVKGYEDGTFRPEQPITRAEFVTLVNNVLGRKVLKENILPDAKTFPDLSPNAWYYEAMMEAINGHYYERENPDDYEVWTELYETHIDL
ncbi:MAG: S-layer homology domain-containing protein [Syntrophomonadaceae bacterium]